ncbi:VasL domain-containing protein [Chimaeribacter arupi]|uniref:VasL domain-containing protein n=1 Tax=Yersiniaceae TaxID=1903411 RepID=UPI0009333891|nr:MULTISPECIES: VasL domain-containing protein [Yersiniaceae]WKZ93522.1 VasL domain-containing protein [Chimaeribacter arupi]
MTHNSERLLKAGGDPRALADFGALREEVNKLTHPARPDVNWDRVEQLSLSLFRQNGIELQTVAWYTLARTHLAGILGLNEGLAMLEALIIHQWNVLWPQPAPARRHILTGLSQRLQTVVRMLNLTCRELPLIYRAEQHLKALQAQLQRLALKEAGQWGELSAFMHNAAARLEERAVYKEPIAEPLSAQARVIRAETPAPACAARQVPASPGLKTGAPVKPGWPWKSFAAGALTTLVMGGAALWGWHYTHPPMTPLPVAASEQALVELGRQSPLWLQYYGFALAAQALPSETGALNAQWQQHIAANALPLEALSGWHQGMAGLRALTARLDALDERKGKYLTGSELKSMVFAITQHFARAVPVEEQLYNLAQTPPGDPLPAIQASQTDMHLHQLLNRYMLLKQHAESAGAESSGTAP